MGMRSWGGWQGRDDVGVGVASWGEGVWVWVWAWAMRCRVWARPNRRNHKHSACHTNCLAPTCLLGAWIFTHTRYVPILFQPQSPPPHTQATPIHPPAQPPHPHANFPQEVAHHSAQPLFMHFKSGFGGAARPPYANKIETKSFWGAFLGRRKTPQTLNF